MEITGRLTADAQVNKAGEDRQVVNFSIAINDSYKPKRSNEFKEITTYINCSYWLNPKSVEWLRKGALVQLSGRIGFNVYNNMDGKAMGSLTFHINTLKMLVFAKKEQPCETAPNYTGQQENNVGSDNDDLPF
ncbi:MAG TPA: single-stranded DNA-binding protein [Pedobacter sp.]|jgi:single-strand DNA-binding protein